MTNTTTSQPQPHPTTPAGPPTSSVTGMNHVAIVTADLDRFVAFYEAVFDATVIEVPAPPPATRAATVLLSASSGLVATEVAPRDDTSGSTRALARGHLEHVAFDAATAADLEGIRRRLVDLGASDGVVHDYGPMLNVSFTDPDGMPSEVCLVLDPFMVGAHPPVPFEGSLVDLDR